MICPHDSVAPGDGDGALTVYGAAGVPDGRMKEIVSNEAYAQATRRPAKPLVRAYLRIAVNKPQCPNQLSRNGISIRETSNQNQPLPVLTPQKPPLNGIGVLLTKSRRRSIPPRLDTSNQPRLQRDPPPNQILLSSTMLHPIVPLTLHVNIRTMPSNNLGRKITNPNPCSTTRFTITDKHEIRCPGDLPGRQNIPSIRNRNGHNIRSVTLLPRNRRTRRHTIRRNTTTRQTKNHNNSDSYTPPEIKHSSPPTSPQSQDYHPTNESHQESTIYIRAQCRRAPETRRSINPSNGIKSCNQLRSNHRSIRRRTQLKIPPNIIAPNNPPLTRMRHPFVRLTGKRSTRSQLPTQIPRTKEFGIRILPHALLGNPDTHVGFDIKLPSIGIKFHMIRVFSKRITLEKIHSDAPFLISRMSEPNNTRYRTNNPLRRVINLPPLRRLNNHSGTPPLRRSRSRSSRIRHRPHRRTPTNTTRHKRNSNQPQHTPPYASQSPLLPHDIRRHTRPTDAPSS